MAREYYQNLYSKEICHPNFPQNWSFLELDHRERLCLNRAVTPTEIEAAVFQMGRHKAPGPDGLPPRFFQHFWHIVGPSVTELLLTIFTTGELPLGLNAATICLLPKCPSPESLSQFRPISVCNVLVKVVSKVLENCLKPLMSKLTGLCQASFIPGRSTVDNIVIAQEVVHSLMKRKGKKAGFILKVGLEKAYDRIDWVFLQEMLKKSGFGALFRKLILHTITSATLSVCWNGTRLDPLTSSRGLRQGDPLSPYLFVLCMEVLGQAISREVQQ